MLIPLSLLHPTFSPEYSGRLLHGRRWRERPRDLLWAATATASSGAAAVACGRRDGRGVERGQLLSGVGRGHRRRRARYRDERRFGGHEANSNTSINPITHTTSIKCEFPDVRILAVPTPGSSCRI